MFKRKKGFTLVEIVCAMAVLTLVFLLATNLLGLGITAKEKSDKEFDLQFSMRTTADIITDKIRYSTAIFVIPASSFNASNIATDKYLTPGWDYIGIVDTVVDGVSASEIVQYIYNKDTNSHQKKVLVPARSDFIYDLSFTKNTPLEADTLLAFFLSGYNDENQTTSYWDLNSELDALNSLQVVDWSTEYDKGRAIAYRSDERTNATIGRVTMVLDNSGSMAWNMNGQQVSVPYDEQRINIMRNAANSILNEFSSTESLEVCLVPFSSNANLQNGEHPTLDLRTIYGSDYSFLSPSSQRTSLAKIVNSFTASGGTNTGDGLRRAYYAFEDAPTPADTTVKEYIIVLVDGDSTFASLSPNPSSPLPPNYFTARGEMTNSISARYLIDDYSPVNGSYNSVYGYFNPTGMYAGSGTTPAVGVIDEHSRTYVLDMGEKLHDRGVKPYVVALSSSVSTAGIQNLRQAFSLSPSSPDVFTALDSNALNAAFTSIKNSILNDLWYLNGPRQEPDLI